MKNLKVSAKLYASFGSTLFFLVIILVFSITAMSTAQKLVKVFKEDAYETVMIVDDIDINLQEGAKNLLYATNEEDSSETNERLEMAKENITHLTEDAEKLKKFYSGNKADVNSIVEEAEKAMVSFESFSELAKENKNEEAFALYKDEIYPELISIVSSVETMQEHANEISEQEYKEVRNRVKYTIIIITVVGILSVLVALAMAGYVTRLLVAGLKDVEEASEKMARGEFDIDIKYNSKDEIGQLADSIRNTANRLDSVVTDIDYVLDGAADGNLCVESKDKSLYVGTFANILKSMENFLEKLNNTMHKINMSSEQVAAGSDQVASGAQALSQGATEQASSIEELAATINVISGKIKENADAAVNASGKTNDAGQQMNAATVRMSDLINAMTEISASSIEIKKIIKTIEDIAFQTNILALNAAVEAARAGSAGKGFAVVADEVRNLAGKSAEATQNTTALIEGTVNAIENGNALVGEVAEMMNVVADTAGEVAKINEDISVASKDAAESIEQITLGVEQISAVVQTNSATAEESAAASEELSSQAQMFKALVAEFNLKGNAKDSYVANSGSVFKGTPSSSTHKSNESTSHNVETFRNAVNSSPLSDPHTKPVINLDDDPNEVIAIDMDLDLDY